MVRKSFWNQGASLIQVMVMGSAVAGLALVTSQMLTNQKKALKTVETKESINQIHSMIYSILQNKDYCLETLAASSLTSLNGVTPQTPRLVTSIRAGGQTAFQASPTTTYLEGTVRIDSMNLAFPDGWNLPGTLDINFVKFDGTKTGYGGENIRKTINVVLSRSSATTADGCTSVKLDDGSVAGNTELTREICNELGITTWDSVNRKCNLKNNTCTGPDAGKIFAGFDNNGDKVCRPLSDYLPVLISSSPQDPCPAGYNKFMLVRDFNPPYALKIECNSASSCGSVYQKQWQVGTPPSTCSANLPRGVPGDVFSVTDNLGPSYGDATFNCISPGTGLQSIWVVQAGATCEADCVPQTLYWTPPGSPQCSALTPRVDNWTTILLEDTVDPTNGSITYRCENGSWQSKGPTTTPAAPAPICFQKCLPTYPSWTVVDETCTSDAQLPTGLEGDKVPVEDTVGTSKGTARFECKTGIGWTQINPPATCNYTGAMGKCKWTTTTTWSENGCSGINSDPVPSSGFVPIKNATQCTKYCRDFCSGKTSVGNCTFIPP